MAQVEGSGIADGVTTGIENVPPSLSVKVPNGSIKEDAFVKAVNWSCSPGRLGQN
jgi:hypothetical protein